MKYLPKGSMRALLSIPQLKNHDVSQVSLSVIGPRIRKFWTEVEGQMLHGGLAKPDAEAIEFYCLNHLVSVIRDKFDMDEYLPDWAQQAVEKYVQVVGSQGQRLFYYMYLITTRESRHFHSGSGMKNYTAPKETEDFLALPESYRTYLLHTVVNQNEVAAASSACTNPPTMNIGTYLDAVGKQFVVQHAYSGGYGGEPWKNIAECAWKMATGLTTIEMMVDNAWALAHNGGPMFNKGMLYKTYSPEFQKILDVQRSGQMPNAVLASSFNAAFSNPALAAMVQSVAAGAGVDFAPEVDWQKVEDLGALNTYEQEKKAAPKKPPKPVELKFLGKKAVITGQFAVMPGQTVTQLKRVAA